MKLFTTCSAKEEAMAMKNKFDGESYKIDAISIGNGTASRETEFFIKGTFDRNRFKFLLFQKPELRMYSTSKIAR
jgi:uncharacterized protein